ncbi:hypothetical protein NMG60_11018605 [Bertholletia excelsa]
MEWCERTTSSPTNTPVSSSPPTGSPPRAIMSPCAACKVLRRRCAENCMLAPYFPPTDPLRFTIAHKVFGASNIIKLLQELPESQRADAVSSIVYEANARIRDPVYGCTGALWQLQRQVSELQAELAKAQAEIVTMQFQQASSQALSCTGLWQSQEAQPQYEQGPHCCNSFNNANLGSAWGSVWTNYE